MSEEIKLLCQSFVKKVKHNYKDVSLVYYTDSVELIIGDISIFLKCLDTTTEGVIIFDGGYISDGSYGVKMNIVEDSLSVVSDKLEKIRDGFGNTTYQINSSKSDFLENFGVFVQFLNYLK